jgi:two-component system OmpR family response regulator
MVVMTRVLCVEDDPTTADYIAKGLTEAGFRVDVVHDGETGLEHALTGHYNSMVLDRMLPKKDGMAVLHDMRAAGITTPVVMLSALASLDDRLAGLRAGADDYLGKPFAFAELLARVEAVRRRQPAGPDNRNPITRMGIEDLEINLLTRHVTRGGRSIDLQPREFHLLEFLLRHRGQIVTRAMLLADVWDCHFDPGTNVIDVHVSRLRKKLDEGGAKPLLHTVRGAGYRLGDP